MRLRQHQHPTERIYSHIVVIVIVVIFWCCSCLLFFCLFIGCFCACPVDVIIRTEWRKRLKDVDDFLSSSYFYFHRLIFTAASYCRRWITIRNGAVSASWWNAALKRRSALYSFKKLLEKVRFIFWKSIFIMHHSNVVYVILILYCRLFPREFYFRFGNLCLQSVVGSRSVHFDSRLGR